MAETYKSPIYKGKYKENGLPNLHEDMFQPLSFRGVQFSSPGHPEPSQPSQEVHLKPPRARARAGKRKPVSPEKENSEVPRDWKVRFSFPI